jgi:hypothetical protein
VEAALLGGFVWGEAAARQQTNATTKKLENPETRAVIYYLF